MGAYILAGSPMSDKSKGRGETKRDLLVSGCGSGTGVTIRSRKKSSQTTGCNELSEEAGLCRTDRSGGTSLLPFMPAGIASSK